MKNEERRIKNEELGAKAYEFRSRQAIGRPGVHRPGPQGTIKAQGSFIPVEDGPFQAAAAALERELGQFRQQRLAVTPATHPRPHEQVFEINSRLA